MIYHAETIDQMIDALLSMKRVGARFVAIPTRMESPDGPLELVTVDLVWVDPRTDCVVGDEAEGYKPRPGDVCVARIQ